MDLKWDKTGNLWEGCSPCRPLTEGHRGLRKIEIKIAIIGHFPHQRRTLSRPGFHCISELFLTIGSQGKRGGQKWGCVGLAGAQALTQKEAELVRVREFGGRGIA